MRHPPLVHTLDELIVPANLMQFMGLPPGTWHVGREKVEGGVSGATIERLLVFDVPNYRYSAVLKLIDPATNWLMRAAGDTMCREIALTQSPLWDRFPPSIDVPILAVARLSDGRGALLLEDVADHIFSASLCYAPPPSDTTLIPTVIAGLAALHASFWEDTTLSSIAWLASPEQSMFVLTPDRIASAGSSIEGTEYGDAALRMWYRFWALIEPADAALLRRTMLAPTALLAAMAAAPTTLVHGDTWVANLGLRAGQLILLDWSLITAGPATFDSLWLAHTWHALDPDAILALHRAALQKQGITAVADDATWSLLVDLAWVRTTLLGIEWLVRDVIGATDNDEDRRARARLHFWCHRAASILQARGW